MSDPLSFVLVGAGAIAQAYVQALKVIPSARVAAVVDPRVDAAKAVAEGLGCRAEASLEDALRAVEPDAAIVCTPPASHPELAIQLLDRGVHVLCEKPLACDLQSARRMLGAAKARRVLLTMGSKFRYVDDVIEAKSLLASGLLGDIVLFENSFTSRVDMSNRWNTDPAVSGGGVLIDNGTHSVDIIRYFLGPIASVQAIEGKRLQTPRVEDTVRLFVRTVSGVVANVDLSWSVNKEQETYIDVYGSGGTIRVGWKSSRYRHASNANWVPFGRGYDKVAAFRKQVENFTGAILGKEQLLITDEDALASVHVIDAAYQSLNRNDWVPVEGAARAA
jgi:predicted dehydrogenase